MRIIVHLQPRGTSGFSTFTISAPLNRAYALSPIFAAAAAAAASTTSAATTSISISSPYSAAAATASVYTSPTDKLRQRHVKDRSHILSTLQLEEDGIQQEGQRCPRRPYVLRGKLLHTPVEVQ